MRAYRPKAPSCQTCPALGCDGDAMGTVAFPSPGVTPSPPSSLSQMPPLLSSLYAFADSCTETSTNETRPLKLGTLEQRCRHWHLSPCPTVGGRALALWHLTLLMERPLPVSSCKYCLLCMHVLHGLLPPGSLPGLAQDPSLGRWWRPLPASTS